MFRSMVAVCALVPSIALAGPCWEATSHGEPDGDHLRISASGITMAEAGECEFLSPFADDGTSIAVSCWQEGDTYTAIVKLTPIPEGMLYSMEYGEEVGGGTEEFTLQACDRRA